LLKISVDSLEYVPVQVTALKSGVPYNPTSDMVQMAFAAGTVTTTPSNLTFNTASWDTSSSAYYALCLIGPNGGTQQLTAGYWTVFVQVGDSPEVPVKLAGQILMY
jgi:hypothetical protein